MLSDRRTMLTATAAVLATGPALAAPRREKSWFDSALIIDGLGGTGDPRAGEGISRMTDATWAELQATGVTAVRTTVMPVGNVADGWADFESALEGEEEFLAANPDRLLLARTAADIARAKREGKHAVVLGTQDTSMVGPELDRLKEIKARGVNSVQLTYNNANLAGDGALETRDAGLTKLGKATIERLEAEKILLDLSHGGARTMAEAAAFAKRPLVISHTGARALADHPRNTADATMRAVAEKGGVIGLYFMPFLTLDSQPQGEALLRHVDHVANLVGEDHVAVGTDNGPLPMIIDDETRERNRKWALERIKAGIASPGEGPEVFPIVADYNSIDRYRRFADDLGRRGWPQRRLEKLMGTNLLRVYRDVWGG